MEIELANFKIEVAKRFERSQITEFKFPRKLKISTEDNDIKGNLTIGFPTHSSTKVQKMAEQWKTIDNYYQKKILHKSNKSHNDYPFQANVRNNMFIDHETKPKDYETHLAPKMQNSSTKAKIYNKIKFDTLKLRENNFQEVNEQKVIESSRNNVQKIK